MRRLSAALLVAAGCSTEGSWPAGVYGTEGPVLGTTSPSVAGDGSGSTTGDGHGGPPDQPVPACDPGLDVPEATGTLLWRQRFSGAGVEDYRQARAIAVDPIGRPIAVGRAVTYTFTGSQSNGVVQAAFIDGTPFWSDDYAGAAGLSDSLSDLAFDDAGNAIVVGLEETAWIDWVDDVEVASTIVVLSYAPGGERRWRQTVSHPTASEMSGGRVATGPNGEIVVAFTGRVADGWEQLAIARLGSGGTVLDVQVPDLPAYVGTDDPMVAVDPTGHVYVAAEATPADVPEDHLVVLKMTPDGSRQWLVSDALPRVALKGLFADEGGAIVLADQRPDWPRDPTYRPIVRRYDPDGVAQWTFELPDGLVGYDLAVDCHDQIVILAHDDQGSWLGRLDGSGLPLSGAPFSSPSSDFFPALAVDAAGNVYLAGDSCDEYPCALLITKLAG